MRVSCTDSKTNLQNLEFCALKRLLEENYKTTSHAASSLGLVNEKKSEVPLKIFCQSKLGIV